MPPRETINYNSIRIQYDVPHLPTRSHIDSYNCMGHVPEIEKVEILNPGKVIRFTFYDERQVKTIRRDEDSWDFEFAFYIAYAKLLYGKYLNPEGIWQKACELKGQKLYVKLVEKAIRRFNRENGTKVKKGEKHED